MTRLLFEKYNLQSLTSTKLKIVCMMKSKLKSKSIMHILCNIVSINAI